MKGQGTKQQISLFITNYQVIQTKYFIRITTTIKVKFKGLIIATQFANFKFQLTKPALVGPA